MGKEKFPKPSDIPWDKIREIRVSSDKSAYSFEFDLQGKKQKMTFAITPNSTAVTLSTDTGNPIVHATQKGKEVRILDFSSKLAFTSPGGKLAKSSKPQKK